MRKKTLLKIASLVLLIHGSVELTANVMQFAPAEFLPAFFREDTLFWTFMSSVYGLSRIVAGISIWRLRKWGMVLAMALGLTSMILSPSIFPFGVMNLPLAIIVFAALSYVWFGDEKIIEGR